MAVTKTERIDNLLTRLDGMRFAFGYSKMDSCHLHTMNELGDLLQDIQTIVKECGDDPSNAFIKIMRLL